MDKTLAQAIASNLPNTWVLKDTHTSYFQIQRSDGLTLSLFNNYNKCTASFCRLSYTDALGESVTYPYQSALNELNLSISFSAEKDAVAVAKDIIKRLLPSANKAYELAVIAKEEHDAYNRKIIENHQLLLANNTEYMDVKTVRKHGTQETNFCNLEVGYKKLDQGYGDINIGRDVEMKLRSVPVGAAIAMLTAWNQWRKLCQLEKSSHSTQ